MKYKFLKKDLNGNYKAKKEITGRGNLTGRAQEQAGLMEERAAAQGRVDRLYRPTQHRETS